MVLKNIIRYFIFLCFVIEIFSCKEKKGNTENLITKDNQNIEKQESKPNEIPKSSSNLNEKWNYNFESYSNPRFGYSVMYPINLDKKTESQNGDGEEFNASDGFKMTVYGSNEVSIFKKSLNDLYQEEFKNHKDVTYKVKKKNLFVISGYDGEYIFYIKKYVGAGSTNTLYMKYPSNLRDKYYDVITVILKSFKEGNIDSVN